MTKARISDGDPRHGTVNGYINLKCRCPSCRDAWTESCRESRQKRAARLAGTEPKHVLSADPQHGRSSTYQNHGCRCDACRVASTDAERRRMGRTAARRFSDAERSATVAMAADVGALEAARVIGVSRSTVDNWCAAAGVTPAPVGRARHGTTFRYDWLGCRCDECSAADEAASVLRRLVPSIPHGTLGGYEYHGCRCADCRRSRQEYDAERKAIRIAARQKSRPGP